MYIVLDEHKSTFHTNNLILMHFDMIMKIKKIAEHNTMYVFAQC